MMPLWFQPALTEKVIRQESTRSEGKRRLPFMLSRKNWHWLTMMFMATMALTGCVSEIWERYAYPDYGSSRADRMCHPYGSCEQGQWVQTGKSEIDAIIDYVSCEDLTLEQYESWSLRTVTMGFEVGHCMEGKGYQLKLL